MRKLKRGSPDPRVLDVIALHYSVLRDRCNCRKWGLYCSKSYEDIFQDTVVFVSCDNKAHHLPEIELIDYFCYRYVMLLYQAVNDNKELKETNYADNQ